MSSFTPQIRRNCLRCSAELAHGALECERCHALVHAAELETMAAEAEALEARGELPRAREQWLMGLPLLPRDSRQAQWIRDHALALDIAADQAKAPEAENKWAKKLGPLGPIAIILAKGKTLFAVIFKLKFLFSLAAFIGLYWSLYGPKFGIGFALLILIHEMGHFIDVKRRGLPAEMPVFLPGFGAYVKWQAMGVSLETRAAVSLAGPLAGFFASLVCTLIWWKTGDNLWAALAHAGAWLNILNLIPVWVLDGGQAALALSKLERLIILTTSLILWWLLQENVFFLVALGATWRVFTKDLPPKPSFSTTAYFIALLVLLGILMHALPA